MYCCCCSYSPCVEVDESGDASGLPLSRYVQRLCNMPIHYDESHQRGFLHRLDVPSSGMILVASTFSAYYDLQFQLSAGMLTRDYAVQSHGWCSDRGTIRASVAWADTGSKKDSPSRVTAGENSQTHLKVLLHSIHMGRALSFMAIRIGTGRKHQIRVHTAHVGHATVSDGGSDAGGTCCTAPSKQHCHGKVCIPQPRPTLVIRIGASGYFCTGASVGRECIKYTSRADVAGTISPSARKPCAEKSSRWASEPQSSAWASDLYLRLRGP